MVDVANTITFFLPLLRSTERSHSRSHNQNKATGAKPPSTTKAKLTLSVAQLSKNNPLRGSTKQQRVLTHRPPPSAHCHCLQLSELSRPPPSRLTLSFCAAVRDWMS